MLDCSNPAQAGPPFSVANSLKRRPLRLSPQIDEHHSQRDPPAAGGYLQPVRYALSAIFGCNLPTHE